MINSIGGVEVERGRGGKLLYINSIGGVEVERGRGGKLLYIKTNVKLIAVKPFIDSELVLFI